MTEERVGSEDPGEIAGRAASDQTAAFAINNPLASSEPAGNFQMNDGITFDKDQWAERWWYLGDTLPRLLYHFDRETEQSLNAEEMTASGYDSCLKRLDDLIRGADEYVSDDQDEEIQTRSEGGEFDRAEDFFQSLPITAADHAFVLGGMSTGDGLGYLHPSPSQIPFYWQTFVENVDPIVKIFHIPTMGKVIRVIQGRIRSLSPAKEALVFAVYFAAVTSMAPDEVQELLNQDKATLVGRYRLGTEQALARAEFMTSADLMTLQAFVLFVSCLRLYVQPRFAWHLTALAVRIAQGLGVHQIEPSLKLSPYDSEMRKRLWLSLWLLDLGTALDVGTHCLIIDYPVGVGLPLNINDSDLDPASTEYPASRTGMTDMMHVLAKYETGSLLKKLRLERVHKRAESPQSMDCENMERIVTSCKDRLELNYLRFCADGNPLQRLTAENARLFFAEAPLLIYHPILTSVLRSSLSQEVTDRLLGASIETIEYSHALEAMSTTHLGEGLFCTYLQWHAIAFILETLCLQSNRTEIAQRSWNAIELAFGHWGTCNRNQRQHGAWLALVKFMKKAKRRRAANLSLYRQEGSLDESDDAGQAAARTWSGMNTSPTGNETSVPSISVSRNVQDPITIEPSRASRPSIEPFEAFGTIPTETQSVSSTYLDLSNRITWTGSHLVEDTMDNWSISRDSLLTNPGLPSSWLVENPIQDASWAAPEGWSENLASNVGEDWAAWNDIVDGHGASN